MKHSLIDILACPVCRGKLELEVEAEEGGEVITGTLHCSECNVDYPITESIPDLMPPGSN